MNNRRLGKKIELAGLTLIPVEELSIVGDHSQFGLSMFVEYRPLGLIIESADERWAIDIEGEPVSEEELFSVDA